MNLWHKIIGIQEHRPKPDLSTTPSPLTDDDVVGFGEYSDTKLRDVPIDYLQWMVDTELDYPRMSRSPRWVMVINWIKSKK